MRIKKNLLMKVLAIAAFSTFFTGCGNVDDDTIDKIDKLQKFDSNFVKEFGTPDPNHNWSMATRVTANIDLSNAPEGTYEVSVYSQKDGYLLKKAFLNKSAELRFDAIKSEDQVRILARKTTNHDLTPIDGFFPVKNGRVSTGSETRAATAEQSNTTVGKYVQKNGVVKTSYHEVYVPERLENEETHDPYTNYPYLSLPNDGKYYIRILPDEDYSNGADPEGKYAVTRNGVTSYLDMHEIYGVIKTENFLLYKTGTHEYDSRVQDPAWNEEWNDLPGTEYHGTQYYGYYTRVMDVVFLAWTNWFHPAYYKSDITTETDMSWVVACEDLGSVYDYDFNDVVFDMGQATYVTVHDPDENESSSEPTESVRAELYLQPLAAGGTRPAYIYYNGKEIGEIHNLMKRGASTDIPINVGGTSINVSSVTRIKLCDIDEPRDEDNFDSFIEAELAKIKIVVKNGGDKEAREIVAPQNQQAGDTPQMLLLPRGWDWPKESVHITEVYPDFKDWVQDMEKNGWITTPQGNYFQNPLK